MAEEILPISTDFNGAGDVVLALELSQRTPIGLINKPLTIRGDAGESLADTRIAAEARRRVMAEYDWLYQQYPDEIRQIALSGIYKIEAVAALSESEWSFDAIRGFYLAARTHPGTRIDLLGAFGLSLFGSRVWRRGQQWFARLNN